MNPAQMKACQNDWWFDDHLPWLLDNKPEWVLKTFQSKKSQLRLFLSQKVDQAFRLWEKLQQNGLDERQVGEVVLDEAVCSPPSENHPNRCRRTSGSKYRDGPRD